MAEIAVAWVGKRRALHLKQQMADEGAAPPTPSGETMDLASPEERRKLYLNQLPSPLGRIRPQDGGEVSLTDQTAVFHLFEV